jgi:hypothetical protein
MVVVNITRLIGIANHSYSVEVPDACPICHRHSEVTFAGGDEIDRGAGVQVIFRCGYVGCRQFFFCYYGPKPQTTLLSVKPTKPQLSVFSEAVRAISPTFVLVFAEAEEAAQLGLKHIAGPGYRKAFEFLIKDYAKSLVPAEQAQAIESQFSGSVVNSFISDPRIQEVAKRSLWLGNDETHYMRKWTEHNIGDLVTLIKLTVHWIDIAHLTKGYVANMPAP